MAGPKRVPVLSVRPAGAGTCEITREWETQFWWTTNFFSAVTATPAANYAFDHFEVVSLDSDGTETQSIQTGNPYAAVWHDGIDPVTGEVHRQPYGDIAVTAVFVRSFPSNLILRNSSGGVILRDASTGAILREGW